MGAHSSCSSSSGNYQSREKRESIDLPIDQLEVSQSDCETAAVSVSNLPISYRELYPSLQSSMNSCHEVDSATTPHVGASQASPETDCNNAQQ